MIMIIISISLLLLLSPLLLAQSKLKWIFSFFNVQLLPDSETRTTFYVKRFSCETKHFSRETKCKDSLFKALMALGPNEVEKCVTSPKSEKKWRLKAFDQDIPHPDTMFLITKV